MTAWRTVAGFSRYVVSNDGQVASRHAYRKDRPEELASTLTAFVPLRILAVRTNHGGYVEVKLFADDGRRVWRKVHNLVLEAFVGPRPSPRHHGAHAPDRDKTNNRVSNLRWATPEENEADKARHGTKTGGQLGACDTHPNRVRWIRIRHERGESIEAIARVYLMHRSSVSRIVRGLRHGAR